MTNMKHKLLDWIFKFIKTAVFKTLLIVLLGYLISLTLTENQKEFNIFQLLGFYSLPTIYAMLLGYSKSCHCHGMLTLKNDTKYYSEYKCVKCATAHYSRKWWIEGYDKNKVNKEINKALKKHKSETQGFYFFED